ncbi:hypothetical protein [Escherichia coli]
MSFSKSVELHAKSSGII